MFENKIKFIANKDYIKENIDRPEPAKLNIPDWYKKLEHSLHNKTVKGCMPFLDTLTIGYILRMPADYSITHNVYNTDTNKKDTASETSFTQVPNSFGNKLNLNKNNNQFHPIEQLGGDKCPIVHKNKNLKIHKLINPWIIKTPPGYSCLFVPPLNNSDDRFSIIPGVVDTDSFQTEINFPMIVNGDKYPVLKSIVKRGTPYVQVIPFKREKWKMSFGSEKHEKGEQIKFFQDSYIINNYKQKYWYKKSWK
tara:strand:+ start:1393 stop:2145 length:753 start_codon:yes stop_codon:yes gene_type:complete